VVHVAKLLGLFPEAFQEPPIREGRLADHERAKALRIVQRQPSKP
jgi:hypothetical protein